MQREGYEGFIDVVEDGTTIKIMPIQADVIIKATLVDDFGNVCPYSHFPIEVKPVSYQGENIKSITNENGMARLKLFFNQEYELSYSHEMQRPTKVCWYVSSYTYGNIHVPVNYSSEIGG